MDQKTGHVRPPLDETYMRITEIYAKRSLCVKLRTAAIIVRFTKNPKCDQIVASGYNGTLSGATECTEHWFETYKKEIAPNTNITFEQWVKSSDVRLRHREWSKNYEMHAEANALRFVSANDTDNCVLYTLYSPCDTCAKAIQGHGISRVVYLHEYSNGSNALNRLRLAGIKCQKLEYN